jgi:hypothetical protein
MVGSFGGKARPFIEFCQKIRFPAEADFFYLKQPINFIFGQTQGRFFRFLVSKPLPYVFGKEILKNLFFYDKKCQSCLDSDHVLDELRVKNLLINSKEFKFKFFLRKPSRAQVYNSKKKSKQWDVVLVEVAVAKANRATAWQADAKITVLAAHRAAIE